MTKFFSRFILFLFLAGIVSGISSCSDPEIIGLDVQPPGDRINVTLSDTTSITAYTIREDSLRTDETTLQLLGSYMDTVFGRTDAGIYAQIAMPTSITDTLNNPSADSLVLSLAFSGYYGDTTAQTFHVYRVEQDMSYDSAYYSNKTFPATVELGSATITPSPNDSVSIYGVKTAPHLRININNTSFGDSLLSLFGHSTLANNTNFLSFFKGLYIKADNATTGGGILYFNLLAAQSKVTLYYQTALADSQHYDFIFSSQGAHMTHFDHDYASASYPNVFAQLNDSTNGSNLVYVQSMAGVKTKIRFPHILDYIKDGMIAINKAEVEITVSDSSTAHWATPAKLLLLGVDSVGGALFLADQFQGSFYYGGDYNSTERTYKFNIARYLQNVLMGITKDYGLYLAVAGGSVQGNRAIICGATHATRPLKLHLYYTRPN